MENYHINLFKNIMQTKVKILISIYCFKHCKGNGNKYQVSMCFLKF